MPAVSNALRPTNETNRFTEGWVTGRSGKRSAVGRMVPQPHVLDGEGRSGLLDDIAGRGFVVFGLDQDPREAMTAEQVKGWDELDARFLTVRSSGKGGEGEIVDHTGGLREWMARFDARVLVVRPDRFVAAADRTGLDVPAPHGNLTPAG